MIGAQALQGVSTTHPIPTAAAIVVIAMATFFAPFFGYKVVHAYERYSWIPIAIIFFIILGISAKHMDSGSVISTVDAKGHVLSFGAVVFGSGIGWSSNAAGEWASSSRMILFISLRLHRSHGRDCVRRQNLLAQLSRSIILTVSSSTLFFS